MWFGLSSRLFRSHKSRPSLANAKRAEESATCDKAVNADRLSFTLLPFPLGKGTGVRSALGGAQRSRAKEPATCALMTLRPQTPSLPARQASPTDVRIASAASD